jgi:glycosyltransferase involved in cell wall biosynthesis
MLKEASTRQGPLVTVLMPVYNGAAYLREAVESILSQSFRDFELLIVDDCSQDDSVHIIKSYSDSRIRLVRCDHRLRLAGALNLGIGEAKGRFIARMDADDKSRPYRIAKQIRFFSQNPSIAICGAAVCRFGSRRREYIGYPSTPDLVKAFALFHCPFSHPTVMFRREWFIRSGFRFDVDYYPTEDYELWDRVLEQYEGANMPDVLLDYRIHPQALTQTDWSMMDAQAGRVNIRQLKRLGLQPKQDSEHFHRRVAMRQVGHDLEQLSRAEKWLMEILHANDRQLIYNRAALDHIVRTLWFEVCMNTTRLGIVVCNQFRLSKLFIASGLDFQRLLILYVSAIRRGYFGKTIRSS